MEGSMWSWGNKNEPYPCRQTDRWTWFRFQPIYGALWTSSPTLKRLCLPLCKVETRTAMRIKWDGVGEAHSREWCVAAQFPSCEGLSLLFTWPVGGASWVFQHLESVSTSFANKPKRDGCILVIPGLFLTICLSAGPSFSVDGKPRLCNINKPILKTIKRK